MIQTIYLTQSGNIRFDAAPNFIKITCTQKQYEKILSLSLFQEYCLTPLNNYKDYKEGDSLRDEDIPNECEFDFPDDEYSDSNFTEEQLLNFFIQDNKNFINKSFEEEIKDNTYFINGKIIKYTMYDRYNLQLIVNQNKPFYFNGEYYSSDKLSDLYHTLENEVLRIYFYKEVLLKMCDALTLEDRNNNNYIEWGMYNDIIAKEMEKYEQPFK